MKAPLNRSGKFILSPENVLIKEGKYFKFPENGFWQGFRKVLKSKSPEDFPRAFLYIF